MHFKFCIKCGRLSRLRTTNNYIKNMCIYSRTAIFSVNYNYTLITPRNVATILLIYLLSFVETPRKFIIAELSIRKLCNNKFTWCFHKA